MNLGQLFHTWVTLTGFVLYSTSPTWALLGSILAPTWGVPGTYWDQLGPAWRHVEGNLSNHGAKVSPWVHQEAILALT